MKTTILFVVLFAFLSTTEAEIGMDMLMIWPTARSTALAGAMTALADEADATYFNPAGLAFQTTAKAALGYGNWLPGLYQGMYYASAAGGAPVRLPFLRGHNAFIAGSLAYMTTGETDIVNERGEFLRRVTTWSGAAGVQVAMLVTNQLGAALGLKALRDSRYCWSWDWGHYVESTAAAADIALLCRPFPVVSIGVAVANLGPPLVYRPSGETDDLPRMARLGACWTAIESHAVRLRVMPELDKLLVGMFSDTTGKSFGRQMNEEWRATSKALGVEMTAFGLVSIRLGYIEDLDNELGGLIYQKEGWHSLQHYGFWDVITRRDIGQFRRIGLCWGLGFGSDELRLDLSSDAAVYDFPTKNWKFQLVSNDIGGLFRRRSSR